MDKNIRQELAENLNNYLIGIDDTFAFKCRVCGKCCKNRDDILLTTRDLFNIAKHFKLTMIQALEKYCESFIGNSSRIPIVRLKPVGPNRNCPLLNGDRCSVHESKPVVCAVFPLGRVVTSADREQGVKAGDKLVIQYILNPINCGSVSRKYTVRQWLERFGIPIDDSLYIVWTDTIIRLMENMQWFEEKKLSDNTLNLMWDGIFSALYVNYDMTKEFGPQFTENTKKITHLVKECKTMYENNLDKGDE
jgi:hypothetical protein